jgi:hypothetical protein
LKVEDKEQATDNLDCLRHKTSRLAKTASVQDLLSMRDTWIVYCSFLLYARLMPKLATGVIVVSFLL